MIIIKTNDFQILKNENNFFTLQLDKPNKSLLLSFLKSGILLGATISDHYQSITFRANKVEINNNINNNNNNNNNRKNKQNLSNYETATKILHDIAKQYKYLITYENKCFYRFDPENIISINNTKYIYVNTNDLLDIQEDDQLCISLPFKKNIFDSPEITKIVQIPEYIHYKTIYYSLAKYILHSLFLFDNHEHEEASLKILQILKKIEGTKLFYALERCLNLDPKERSLLFI
jgi:hypothetical protein